MSWVLNRQKHRLAPRNLPGSLVSPSELTAHSNLHASKAPGRCRRWGECSHMGVDPMALLGCRRLRSQRQLSGGLPMSISSVSSKLFATALVAVGSSSAPPPPHCLPRCKAKVRQGQDLAWSRWPLPRRDRRHQDANAKGDAGMSNGAGSICRTPTPSSRPCSSPRSACRSPSGRQGKTTTSTSCCCATKGQPGWRQRAPADLEQRDAPVFAQALKGQAWAVDEVKPDT